MAMKKYPRSSSPTTPGVASATVACSKPSCDCPTSPVAPARPFPALPLAAAPPCPVPSPPSEPWWPPANDRQQRAHLPNEPCEDIARSPPLTAPPSEHQSGLVTFGLVRSGPRASDSSQRAFLTSTTTAPQLSTMNATAPWSSNHLPPQLLGEQDQHLARPASPSLYKEAFQLPDAKRRKLNTAIDHFISEVYTCFSSPPHSPGPHPQINRSSTPYLPSIAQIFPSRVSKPNSSTMASSSDFSFPSPSQVLSINHLVRSPSARANSRPGGAYRLSPSRRPNVNGPPSTGHGAPGPLEPIEPVNEPTLRCDRTPSREAHPVERPGAHAKATASRRVGPAAGRVRTRARKPPSSSKTPGPSNVTSPIAQDLINELSEYHLVYWAETHTVVCTKCPTPTVLWQANASSHWKQLHVRETFAPPRPISTLLALLPNIAKRDTEVAAPEPGLPARPFLAPPRAGFQCPFCSWACIEQKKVREHLRKAHPEQPAETPAISTLIQGQGRTKPLWFPVTASTHVGPTPASNDPLYVSAMTAYEQTRLAHLSDLTQRAVSHASTGGSEVTIWSSIHGFGPFVRAKGAAELVALLRPAETPLEVALDRANTRLWDLLAPLFHASPHYARNAVLRVRKEQKAPVKPPLQSVKKYSQQSALAARFLLRQYLARDGGEPSFTEVQIKRMADLITWLTPDHPAPAHLRRSASHESGDEAAEEAECSQTAACALELFLCSLFEQPCEPATTAYSLGRYLAAQSISPRTCLERPAKNYTAILVPLLFLARALVLSSGVALFPERKTDYQRYVTACAESWLQEESMCIFQDMLRLLALGMRVAEKTTSIVNYTIVDDDRAIQYGSKLLPLESLRLMPHKLVVEAREFLLSQLLFDIEAPLPTRDQLLRITDDLTNDQPGYCFADAIGASRMGTYTDVIHTLTMSSSPPAGLLHRDGEGRAQFSPTALLNYENRCKSFLEKLIILILMTSGLPPRATELVSIRVQNFRRPRNIFVIDGQVMLAIEYNKNNVQRLGENTVIRFLPFPVSQLIVKYICCCHSFLCHLADVSNPYLFTLFGTAASTSANASAIAPKGPPPLRRRKPCVDVSMFFSSSPTPDHDDEDSDGPPPADADINSVPADAPANQVDCTHRSADWLYPLVPKISEAALGIGFHLRDWRQIITAIDRHFLHVFDQDRATAQLFSRDDCGPQESAAVDQQPSLHDRLSAAQSGHHVFTHQRHYNSSCVPNLRHLDSSKRQLFAVLSGTLHAWFYHLSPQSATPMLKPFISHAKKPLADANPHSPEQVAVSAEVLADFPRIEWPWGSPDCFPRPTGPPPSWAEDHRLQVALTALFHTGPEESPSWRSEDQRRALDIILRMKRQQRLFVVLPTAGGKSLLYQVPALLDVSRTVVIVLPFTALMQEVQQSCARLNISCQKWSRRMGDTVPMPKLIVISGEAGAGNAFYRKACADNTPSFINWARVMSGQISYIFVDEVHVPFVNDEYRDLGGLRDLFALRVPIVGLSATLPPSCYESMGRLFTEGALKGSMLFRTSTDRPQLQYSVLTASPYSEELIAKLLELLSCDVPNHTRMAVYVRTTRDATWYASRLNEGRSQSDPLAVAYHNDLESRVTKADQERLAATKRVRLNQWLKGLVPVIVATSALGTGIDLPAVRVVVHIATAYQFLEQIQQMGRAGRDGLPARCVTLLPPSAPAELRPRQKRKESVRATRESRALARRHVDVPGDVWAEKEYVSGGTHQCRRAALIAYMDGLAGLTCHATGAALCDLCRQRQRKVHEDASKAWVLRQVQSGPMDQYLKRPQSPGETDKGLQSPGEIDKGPQSPGEIDKEALEWPSSPPRAPRQPSIVEDIYDASPAPSPNKAVEAPPPMPLPARSSPPARVVREPLGDPAPLPSIGARTEVLCPVSSDTVRGEPVAVCGSGSDRSRVAATILVTSVSASSPPSAQVAAPVIPPRSDGDTGLELESLAAEDISLLMRDVNAMEWSDDAPPPHPAAQPTMVPVGVSNRGPTTEPAHDSPGRASSPRPPPPGVRPHPPSNTSSRLSPSTDMWESTPRAAPLCSTGRVSLPSDDFGPFVSLTESHIERLTDGHDVAAPIPPSSFPPSPTPRFATPLPPRKRPASHRSESERASKRSTPDRLSSGDRRALRPWPGPGHKTPEMPISLTAAFLATSEPRQSDVLHAPDPKTPMPSVSAYYAEKEPSLLPSRADTCSRSSQGRTIPASARPSPPMLMTSSASQSLSANGTSAGHTTISLGFQPFPTIDRPPPSSTGRDRQSPRAAPSRRPLGEIKQGRSTDFRPGLTGGLPAKSPGTVGSGSISVTSSSSSAPRSSPCPPTAIRQPVRRPPPSSRLSQGSPASAAWSGPVSSPHPSQSARQQESITSMLDPLRGQCMMHFYQNLTAAPGEPVCDTRHDMFEHLKRDPDMKQDWRSFKDEVRYDFSGLKESGCPAWCHKCHIPLRVCGNTKGRDTRCLYNDVVIPLIWMWFEAADDELFSLAVCKLPHPMATVTKSTFQPRMLVNCPTASALGPRGQAPFSWFLFEAIYDQLDLKTLLAQGVN